MEIGTSNWIYNFIMFASSIFLNTQTLKMETINEYSSLIWKMTINYLPNLALAVITLIIGLIIIGSAVKVLNKQLSKRAADVSLVTFLCSLIGVVLKSLLLISIASMVGIETTSFVAILGAAGLAIDLALQGSLANFAGGVLILMFKL